MALIITNLPLKDHNNRNRRKKSKETNLQSQISNQILNRETQETTASSAIFSSDVYMD